MCVCFSLSLNVCSYGTLDASSFPLLDIAMRVGSSIRPLDLVMDIVSDGYCGTIAALTEGVYVPVIHVRDWKGAEPKGLTKGEKVYGSCTHALQLR